VVEVGYAAAFLGGLFALLSPCSAVLLPSFFAYAFPGRSALLVSTVLFYLGLCAVLVPLGMGSALASRLFYGHQELLITGSGILLIAFGLVQLAGQGWAIGPLERLRGRVRGDSPAAVLALGAVSGLAGFCAGPVLGGVLTIAAASGDTLRGAVLLSLYAAGMTVPLLLLALVWRRFDLGHRRWLRGRGRQLGPLRLHTTTLASGLTFIGLGVLVLAFDGTRALSLPVPEAWEAGLQEAAAAVRVPDPLVVAGAGIALSAIMAWRLVKVRK
jgi:cytochrome c biogenesis protein CcdA